LQTTYGSTTSRSRFAQNPVTGVSTLIMPGETVHVTARVCTSYRFRRPESGTADGQNGSRPSPVRPGPFSNHPGWPRDGWRNPTGTPRTPRTSRARTAAKTRTLFPTSPFHLVVVEHVYTTRRSRHWLACAHSPVQVVRTLTFRWVSFKTAIACFGVRPDARSYRRITVPDCRLSHSNETFPENNFFKNVHDDDCFSLATESCTDFGRRNGHVDCR